MEVIYQWYDHLIRRTEQGEKIIRDVEQAIETHDFKRFMELRSYLNSLDKDMLFLPSKAFVYEDNNYNYSEIIDITIEENFNKITENQYECG